MDPLTALLCCAGDEGREKAEVQERRGNGEWEEIAGREEKAEVESREVSAVVACPVTRQRRSIKRGMERGRQSDGGNA